MTRIFKLDSHYGIPQEKGTKLRSVLFPEIVFTKTQGKEWESSSSGGMKFNNIGDLMWEWGQHEGLELIDPVQEAVDYLEGVLIGSEVRKHVQVLIDAAKKNV